MQIVIDIPEEVKIDIEDILHSGRNIPHENIETLLKTIVNGTPLPKGHGRLVDADEIDNNIYDLTRSMDLNYGQISEVVDTAPTIIEADEVVK